MDWINLSCPSPGFVLNWLNMRIPWIGLTLLTAMFGLRAQGNAELRIDSPARDEAVSGIVEISGTADAAGMVRYRIEFAYDPNPTDTWFPIAESTTPVRSGLLAAWDTSTLREGKYLLRLIAYFGNDSATTVEASGIRVYRALPATPAPVMETTVPLGDDTSNIPLRAKFVFPAPTATPLSGVHPIQSAQTGPLGLSLAIGAGTVLTGFSAWLIGSRWVLWNHRRHIRAVRKGGNKHE
jgi:hypothetical protein